MSVRVSDYIMSYLAGTGVDTVFMLSGGGMMHLVDAVARQKGIRYVCHHHEQACVMAADGYARRTGKLGVCMATSGPGGTNTLTGLVGAFQDSTPLICLTGQSKTTQTIQCSGIARLRQFGTFEVDIVPVVSSVTKYAVMVVDPQTIRYHLEKALYLATSGRPGPVVLDIPLNVQGAQIDPETLEGFEPVDDRMSVPDIRPVIEALQAAKRPLLLAGIGVRRAGAVDDFLRLAETLNIPVATTQLGKDVVPYDHALFVGHPGPKGDRAGNFAVQSADVIVALGCSLHSQTTGWENELFAPNATKILVDPDAAVLAREKVNVAQKYQCDVKAFLSAAYDVASAAPKQDRLAWRKRCSSWKNKYAVINEPHEHTTGQINYYDVVESLSKKLHGGECIVADAGSSFYVLGQSFRIATKDQRFVSSGSLGAMGFALPAANGAAIVGGDTTVCVTGDGSLMTNLHDLAVTRHHNLNLKLFVMNNGGYLSIRNTQKSFFNGMIAGTDAGSGVFIPPIANIAKCFGLPYLFCDRTEDIDATVDKALATQGPIVVEMRAMFDQKIIPSVSSVRLPDGRMQSKPLHDMAPYLSEAQLAEEMSFSE